jgi:hypothetical protein
VSNFFDLLFLVSGQVLALGVIALSIWKGTFRRYSYLLIYSASLIVGDLSRLLVLRAFGLRSTEYFLAYYGVDACLVLLKYLVVFSFIQVILQDSPLRSQARVAFLCFAALVAAMSYGFTVNLAPKVFYKRLIIEFQQNMYFASVLLTVLLCLALAHLRVTNPQLRMLVCGLGVSGALQASAWALQNLVSKEALRSLESVTLRLGPLATVTMLALWCYAIARIPAVEQSKEESLEQAPEESGRIPVARAAMGFTPSFARVGGRG